MPHQGQTDAELHRLTQTVDALKKQVAEQEKRIEAIEKGIAKFIHDSNPRNR